MSVILKSKKVYRVINKKKLFFPIRHLAFLGDIFRSGKMWDDVMFLKLISVFN